MFTISALAGTQRIGEYDITKGHIELLSMMQWGFFLTGLSLCGFFLLMNIFGQSKADSMDSQQLETESDRDNNINCNSDTDI